MKGPLEWWRFRREHRWTQSHISDYLDRDLAEAERARADSHMSICPQCRRVLATLRAMVERLGEIGLGSRSRAGEGARAERGPSKSSAVAEGVIEALRRGG